MKSKSLIKSIYFLFLIIAFSSCSTSQTSLTRNPQEVEKEILKMNGIVNDFISLIRNNQFNHNEVFKVIELVELKLKSGALKIIYEPMAVKKVLVSSRFEIRQKNGLFYPYIILNKDLLDIYSNCPSAVFSIIMHEMSHAADFFNQTENFLKTKNNQIEKFFYQMDSIHREALLIKYYLVPLKYKISPFENYLLYSFENDKLINYAMTTELTDKRLVYELDNLSKNKDSIEKNLEIINQAGLSLLNHFSFPENKEVWEQQFYLVPIHTYLKFTPQAVCDIFFRKAGMKDASKKTLSELSPEVAKTLNALDQKIKPYLKNFYQNHYEMLSKMNDFFYPLYSTN